MNVPCHLYTQSYGGSKNFSKIPVTKKILPSIAQLLLIDTNVVPIYY